MMYFHYDPALPGVMLYPIAGETVALIVLGLLLISAAAIALVADRDCWAAQVHEYVRKKATSAAAAIENVVTRNKGLLSELEKAA